MNSKHIFIIIDYIYMYILKYLKFNSFIFILLYMLMWYDIYFLNNLIPRFIIIVEKKTINWAVKQLIKWFEQWNVKTINYLFIFT